MSHSKFQTHRRQNINKAHMDAMKENDIEWVTPKFASAVNVQKVFTGNGHLMNSTSPPLIKGNNTDRYSLDSVPQKLSPNENRNALLPSKLHFGHTDNQFYQTEFVPLPQATEEDVIKFNLRSNYLNTGLQNTERIPFYQNKTTPENQHYPVTGYTSTISSYSSHSTNNPGLEALKLEHLYVLGKMQTKYEENEKQYIEKIQSLNKELGCMENEVDESKRKHQKDLEEYDKKARLKQESIDYLEGIVARTRDELASAKKCRNSLQSYLQDVPTREDLKKATDKVRELVKIKEELALKLQLSNKNCKEYREEIKKKIKEIDALENSKEEVQLHVDKLNSSLTKYRERDNAGPVDIQEYEECLWENERLKSQIQQLKQSCETKHKKMKALHHQKEKNEKQFQEQISREEDTVNALQKLCSSKDENMKEIETSLRDMSMQQQQMLEENLKLNTKIRKYDELYGGSAMQVHTRIDKELTRCRDKYKSLLVLCQQRFAGQEPDIQDLLGVPNNGETDNGDTSINPFSSESIQEKCKLIQELHHCADELRSMVSDQYAEQMALGCTMQ